MFLYVAAFVNLVSGNPDLHDLFHFKFLKNKNNMKQFTLNLPVHEQEGDKEALCFHHFQ